MKTRDVFRITAAAALLALLALVPGCDLGFPRTGTGTVSAVIEVPVFRSASSRTGSRLIDPRTETVTIIVNDKLYGPYNLDALEVLGSSDPELFTARRLTFELNTGTYHRVRVYLSDADGTLLCTGERTDAFTVTENGVSDIDVVCLPVDTEEIEAYDVEYTGTLEAGEVRYYTMPVSAGAVYTLSAAGSDVTVYVFGSAGTFIASGTGTVIFTTTAEDGDEAYLCLYSAGGSGYTLSLSKPVLPSEPDRVLINEINLADGLVELYNPTDAPVDLSGWRIRVSRKYDDTFFSSTIQLDNHFFPSVELPADGYLVTGRKSDGLEYNVMNRVDTEPVAIVHYSSGSDGMYYNEWRIRAYSDPDGKAGLEPASVGYDQYVYTSIASARVYGADAGLPSAAVSPDGRSVAYTTDRRVYDDGTGEYVILTDIEIVQVFSDGTGPFTIVSDGDGLKDLAWTPDGLSLLFAGKTADGTYDLFNVDVTDPASPGIPAAVVTNPGDDRYPSFDPDGTRFVYTAVDPVNGDLDLVIREVSGGAETPLPESDGGNEWNASWSPDGTRIAYLAGSDQYSAEVTLYDVTAQTVTAITDAGGFGNPEWQSSSICTYLDPDSYASTLLSHHIGTDEIYSFIQVNDSVVFCGLLRPPHNPDKVNTSLTFHEHDNDYGDYPVVSGFGFGEPGSYFYHGNVYAFELLNPAGESIDFVELNGRSIRPSGTYGEWDPMAGVFTPAGETMSRKVSGATVFDTNTVLDWEDSHGTLGFPNDTKGDEDVEIGIQ